VTTLRRTTLLALATALLLAAVAAPASAAWKKVLTYQGAETQACKEAQPDGTLRVNVRLDNSGGSEVASGGLNRVRDNGSPANEWTYTRGATRPGTVSNTVSLDFARGSRVYLLVGSRYGITGERVVKVSSLPRC
jgi:hypothetical protein